MASGQHGLPGVIVRCLVEQAFSLGTGSAPAPGPLAVACLVRALTMRTKSASSPRVTVGYFSVPVH